MNPRGGLALRAAAPEHGHRFAPAATKLVLLAVLSISCVAALSGVIPQASASAPHTTLSISGARFLVNDKPTFLLGFSYFAALGAGRPFIQQDLDDFQKAGFNWLRIWATWNERGTNNISAVDAKGEPRPPFLDRLESLIADCDRRGLIVDVTLTRGKRRGNSSAASALPDFASHQQAVRTLVARFKAYRNWYLDLANEHDIRDDRCVSDAELAQLRRQVRELDPQRLVTASFGGHDLTEEDLRAAIQKIGLDFLCPHRPRGPESAGQTESITRELLAVMQNLQHPAPVLYQEPFRRGYANWEPGANDFLTDLAGAVSGGAAGWCFHNGSERPGAPSGSAAVKRARSFDLSTRRLFDQLDPEERRVLAGAKEKVPQRAR